MDKINRVLQALGVEKITILTAEKYPPQYHEWLQKKKALQEVSASQDETSVTKRPSSFFLFRVYRKLNNRSCCELS
ncbi:hypothetical protein [Laceyella putida]|uniref:Uncharacterized protein n=1 Tax=Laceyella putida TaxID=110101 RepID=A0ABW2RK52_9BACL